MEHTKINDTSPARYPAHPDLAETDNTDPQGPMFNRMEVLESLMIEYGREGLWLDVPERTKQDYRNGIQAAIVCLGFTYREIHSFGNLIEVREDNETTKKPRSAKILVVLAVLWFVLPVASLAIYEEPILSVLISTVQALAIVSYTLLSDKVKG